MTLDNGIASITMTESKMAKSICVKEDANMNFVLKIVLVIWEYLKVL